MGLVTAALLFGACADDVDTSFVVDEPDGHQQRMELNSLDVLRHYADSIGNGFRIAAPLSQSDFTALGKNYSKISSNFNEVDIDGLFLHQTLVNNHGAVDSTSATALLDLSTEKQLPVYGAVLCSNENLNATYLYSTIADEVIPGKEEKGSDTFSFDDMAIGTTFPVAANGEAKSATAEIVEDPDGVSGHVIHVAKASIAFPVITINFPNGRKLGDYQKLTYDYKAMNDGALNGFATHMRLNNAETNCQHDYPLASVQGCTLKEWGRQKMVIDLSRLPLSDADKELTSVQLEMGATMFGVEYYMDNFRFDYDYIAPGKVIEKTAEEKKAIVGQELQHYVGALTKSYSQNIDTWIVADRLLSNDPFFNLKGQESDPDESKFYWADYMGDNVVADAVKAARTNAPQARLMVREDNLDADGFEKLDRLSALLQQWDAAGGKVDGIDAIINLKYSRSADVQQQNEAAITALLQKLAATGRLIRLSGLEVMVTDESNLPVNMDELMAADRQGAAAFLRTVISSYRTIIPTAQQYGIAFSATNTSSENVGLWDKSDNRIEPYAGTVNGLTKNTIHFAK